MRAATIELATLVLMIALGSNLATAVDLNGSNAVMSIQSTGALAGTFAATPAVMPTQSVGTLAPLGTFASETATVRTRLKLLHERAGAAKVRKLLEASIAACGEDSAGRCTKNSVAAHRLLRHASVTLTTLEK